MARIVTSVEAPPRTRQKNKLNSVPSLSAMRNFSYELSLDFEVSTEGARLKANGFDIKPGQRSLSVAKAGGREGQQHFGRKNNSSRMRVTCAGSQSRTSTICAQQVPQWLSGASITLR